jgi:hypothetical protein
MTRKIKVALAAALVAALASPAFAYDEWVTDGGRYVNGDVPSYTTRAPYYAAPLYATRAPRVIEGRNAAVIDSSSSRFGRDALTESLGN